MTPEQKILLYFIILFTLVFGSLLGITIMQLINPTWVYNFMTTWGIYIVGALAIVVIAVIFYLAGMFRAIKFVWIDFITGGMRFAGITTKDPIEVDIRYVLGEKLPPAQVTLIPISKFWGTPVLMPVSKERGASWSHFTNNSSLYIQFLNFYAREITLDEFLCRVYGLSPETYVSDRDRLRKLKQLVDHNRAKNYILISPYESTENMVKVMEASPHPTITVAVLNILERITSMYRAVIWMLMKHNEKLLESIKVEQEEHLKANLEVLKSSIRSTANPLNIVAVMSGIPASKVPVSTLPQLMESPRGISQAGEMIMKEIKESAKALGQEVIPEEVYEKLVKLDNLVDQLIQGKVTPTQEEREKKELEKAEGRE